MNSSDLLLGMARAESRLNRRVDQALSVHGISFSEYLTLRALSQAPEQKMRRIDLAEATALTPSGVTRLLNPLEKIGLVRKEAGLRDARVSLVALTESGERICAEAQVALDAAADTAFRNVAESQRQQLREILALLA